ncbi:MAG: hypothetical protein IJV56_05220 [Neisseriaceae bacterium]|nr:hypothetical protein [Neisseriaceae bacterium]
MMSYSSYDADTSVLDWIIVFVLMAIPIVNIIYLAYGAFASSNGSIKNYCRASWIVIAAVALFAIFAKGI